MERRGRTSLLDGLCQLLLLGQPLDLNHNVSQSQPLEVDLVANHVGGINQSLRTTRRQKISMQNVKERRNAYEDTQKYEI